MICCGLDSSDEIHVIRFKDEKIQRGSRIYMNGVPFMIVGTRLMECHQGPSHYKSVGAKVFSILLSFFFFYKIVTVYFLFDSNAVGYPNCLMCQSASSGKRVVPCARLG